MTGLLVDTSALLAVLDADDRNHRTARTLWEKVIGDGRVLVTHNYILVETSALAARKLGMEAVRVLEQDVVPILRIFWVTDEIHRASVGAHLAASRRDLSLVDCVTFEIMRRSGLREALAFDRHFVEFGFELPRA